MIITFWSVRISDVKVTLTDKVTTYDVGGAVRHELKHTAFHARWVALGTAAAVAGLAGYAQMTHGRLFASDPLDAVLMLGLMWALCFLLAAMVVGLVGTDRAAARMVAMARAAHGPDRRVEVAHPTSLGFSMLGPRSVEKEYAAGDVMLFTETAWERLLESRSIRGSGA